MVGGAGGASDSLSPVYFFSILLAAIAVGLVLAPFTSTLVPLITAAHVVSSNFVLALVVTLVDLTVNVNAGHA